MRTIALALSLLGLTSFAVAQTVSLPKVGNCPEGYSASGNYCVGGANAPHAMPKTGNCPAGYRVSGGYCIK